MPENAPAAGYGELIKAAPTDPVAAYLAEVGKRAEEAAELPLEEIASFKPGGVRAIAGWIAASALDVSPLRVALSQVLALCRDTDGNYLPGEAEVPVGEFLAVISAALLGEPEGSAVVAAEDSSSGMAEPLVIVHLDDGTACSGNATAGAGNGPDICTAHGRAAHFVEPPDLR